MYKIILSITLILLFSVKGYSQCDTVNRAVGIPQWAAFGSETSDNLEPYRAFDVGAGSDTTHWGTTNGATTQWVGMDFGQPLSFCSIYMQWDSNDYPTNFVIRGTNDWSHWVDLKTVSGNTSSTFTVTDLPDTGTYSVIQIYLYGRHAGSANYNLYNCRMYTRIADILPAVKLTGPANGAWYLLGNNIDITANASDADGSISKVEFYRDTTKLGTDSTAPYSYTWSNADTGRYAIYAKAIDNLGGSKRSDTAVVRVSNAPASLRSWNLNGSIINNSNIGYVAIGKIPGHLPTDTSIKLTVNGYIYAKKLTITQTVWADYVFKPSYRLRPLKDVEAFIHKYQHLPEVPSVKQIEKEGISVGENQALLLKKIEELTLYMIQQNKALGQMKKEIEALKKDLQKNKTGIE